MRKNIINLITKENRKSIKRNRNKNDIFKIECYKYDKTKYYKRIYFQILQEKKTKKNIIKFKNKRKTSNKF